MQITLLCQDQFTVDHFMPHTFFISLIRVKAKFGLTFHQTEICFAPGVTIQGGEDTDRLRVSC